MGNKLRNVDDYYLGLDIGTESVGWAVTDKDYVIPKFKGNAMWGVHLFDEGETSVKRRGFRSARRRTQRKRERLALLVYTRVTCGRRTSPATINTLFLQTKIIPIRIFTRNIPRYIT